MSKLILLNLSAALVVILGVTGADALGAELEGALQYPPPSIGEDAQPPPPARTLPQPVSPWRIELGVSGSSVPPARNDFSSAPRCDGMDPEPRLRAETAVEGRCRGHQTKHFAAPGASLSSLMGRHRQGDHRAADREF